MVPKILAQILESLDGLRFGLLNQKEQNELL